MIAELVCVGTELLLGDTLNTNAQFLSKELAALGINVYYQTVCGDNPARLRETLALALSRSDLVITTGGLGPTYDDLTKETAAELLGLPMELHRPSLERIRAFFARRERTCTPNNEKQAMMPRGALVFDNDYGTAPALCAGSGEKKIILLPGPPREMQGLWRDKVRPYLLQFCDRALVSRNIRLYGVGESAVEQRLKPLMEKSENPTVAPYAKDGEVLLRVTASAETPDAARELTEGPVREIEEIFGDAIYGIDVDSLWEVTVAALRERGLRVATAESCTGGLLGSYITSVPGASDCFECGVITYANRVKEKLLGVLPETLAAHGAVSEETAREMAAGARALSGADIAVSITGIAGPGGGSEQKPVGTVYVACDDGREVTVRHLVIGRGGNERELVRKSACLAALDLVRRAALARD